MKDETNCVPPPRNPRMRVKEKCVQASTKDRVYQNSRSHVRVYIVLRVNMGLVYHFKPYFISDNHGKPDFENDKPFQNGGQERKLYKIMHMFNYFYPKSWSCYSAVHLHNFKAYFKNIILKHYYYHKHVEILNVSVSH